MALSEALSLRNPGSALGSLSQENEPQKATLGSVGAKKNAQSPARKHGQFSFWVISRVSIISLPVMLGMRVRDGIDLQDDSST